MGSLRIKAMPGGLSLGQPKNAVELNISVRPNVACRGIADTRGFASALISI